MTKKKALKKTLLYFFSVFALTFTLCTFCFAAKTTAPKITKISVSKKTSTSITLTWTVEGKAAGYRVYRYNTKTQKYTQLKNLRKTTFTVTDLVPGEYYVFAVRPYYNNDGKVTNAKIKNKTAYTSLDTVTKISQKTAEPNSHRLSWSKVRGADLYEIWYYKKETGRYVSLGGTDKRTCNMTHLEPASVYKYKIRAISVTENGKMIYSKLSKAFAATTGVAAVTGFKAANITTESYELRWNAVQNAQAYFLYRFNDETGDYDQLAVLNTTQYSVSDKESAERDSYRIRAYAVVDSKKVYSEMSEVLNASTKPEAVSLYKADDFPRNGKVVLEWDTFDKADGYLIYVSKKPDSGFSLAKDVSGAQSDSAVIEGLENKVTYYFKIKTYVSVSGEYVCSEGTDVVAATP